jgi:hypothetical protein
VLSLDGVVTATYALGSAAQVYAAPVVVEGVVYVLAADATLTAISGTGLVDYGAAYWPRFRHDNAGTGVAGG